mgnify:CR=1 FL=1
MDSKKDDWIAFRINKTQKDKLKKLADSQGFSLSTMTFEASCFVYPSNLACL